MRPRRGANGSEDHHHACRARLTEPPTMMEPAPASDKVISDPGHRSTWGHTLGKKQQTNIRILFQNVGGMIPTMDGDLKLTIL